jgi:hypothetical protein
MALNSFSFQRTSHEGGTSSICRVELFNMAKAKRTKPMKMADESGKVLKSEAIHHREPRHYWPTRPAGKRSFAPQSSRIFVTDDQAA